MANNLVVAGSTLARLTEQELMEVMESSVYPGAKPASIKLALAYCLGDDLDPLQKPVHIVPMRVKMKKDGKEEYVERDVLMPGINRHRVQAARSSEYAGQTETQFGEQRDLFVNGEQGRTKLDGFVYPEWASVTVFRLVGGEPRPFPAKVYFLEMYATKGRDSDVPNEQWRKRPYQMLEKCAEAAALRKAFPDRAGAPTAEEMAGKVLNDGDTIEGTVTAERREPSEPRRKSADAPAPAPAGAVQPPAPAPAAAGPANRSNGPGSAEDPLIGEKKWIENKCKARKIDLVPFLKSHGLDSLDQLTAAVFPKIQAALKEAA